MRKAIFEIKKQEKKESKNEKAKQASLDELKYGHYGYPYSRFLCFSFLPLLILSIICRWFGCG